RGFHSLVIVTSAYHMPRALAEISHQLPDVALIPYPVVSDRLRLEPWWSNGATTRLVLSEYFKYLYAHLRMRFESVAAETESVRLASLRPPNHHQLFGYPFASPATVARSLRFNAQL